MLRDETDLDRRELFIGELHFNHEHKRFARLTVRALATRSGWKKVPGERFPDEGQVFSTDAKFIGKLPGYVVLFSVVRNDWAGAKDKFVTDAVDEPYEYVESVTGFDPERLRQAVVTHGLDLKQQSDGRIVVPVGSEMVATPAVKRSAETARWMLSHTVDAEAIETYENEIKTTELFEIGGRKFLMPGRAPRGSTGTVNWQTDAEFLQMLLRRLRKNADFGSGSDDFKLSERLATRMFGLFRDADAIGDRFGTLTATRDRLDEFLPKLREGSEAVALIADTVLSNPAVRAALAVLTDKDKSDLYRRETDRIRPDLIRAVEEEISGRRLERDGLSERIAKAEEDLRTKEERLGQVEKALQEASTRLDGKLGTFIGEMREAGQAITQLVALAGDDTAPVGDMPRGDRMAPWGRTSGGGERVTLAVLPRLLVDRAKATGLDPDAFKALDVRCRAGEIPTLQGDSVDTLLRNYADVVAGGRLVRQPLDPAVIGSEDLWRHPGSGLPTALAQAWSDASSEGRTAVVCLDDLERASLSEWMPAFRKMFRTSRPAGLFVVTTAYRSIGEPARTPIVGSENVVWATGGDDALTAALMNFEAPPGTTELSLPFADVEVAMPARMALLTRAKAVGSSGADVGIRLLALYTAATAWSEGDGAAGFAISCLPKAGTDVTPTGPRAQPIPLDRHLDRKAQS